MSVPNPYSDVKVPTYFANEAFEPEQGSELKEKSPTNFLHSGTVNSDQQNGVSAKKQPALVPNPYGSIYGSPAAGSSESPEGEAQPCLCCKLCKCCRCCYSCIIS